MNPHDPLEPNVEPLTDEEVRDLRHLLLRVIEYDRAFLKVLHIAADASETPTT